MPPGRGTEPGGDLSGSAMVRSMIVLSEPAPAAPPVGAAGGGEEMGAVVRPGSGFEPVPLPLPSGFGGGRVDRLEPCMGGGRVMAMVRSPTVPGGTGGVTVE